MSVVHARHYCMLLTAWGVFLLFLVVQLDRFFTCTDGHLFWLFTQGWLAAPLTLTCPMVFSCARGTPILAGGIGVARLVAGVVFCFVVVCLFGQVFVSAFACNATGLDAVQRLEQKKSRSAEYVAVPT